MRRFTLLIVLLVAARPITGQTPLEHFEGVEYRGGLSGYKPPHTGWLVLADSALEYHECWYFDCTPKNGSRIRPDAQITIPWRKMVETAGAADRKGPGLAGKVAFGFLASGTRDELVTISYETESTAEAPVFRTKDNESAQLIAKIKFHLRKLGLIASGPPQIHDSTHP